MFKNKSNTNNTFKFLFSVSGPADNFKNDAHCRKIYLANSVAIDIII